MLELFEEEQHPQKSVLGHTSIVYKDAAGILTPGKGFMDEYDFTLNPYSGCSFGCTYCYAAFFSRSEEKSANWGKWLEVKQNALKLLIKFRRKPLHGKSIYMSSVTDPYQPIEKDLELTRSLIKELADYHQPRLVIQTRSQLATRDIDLFKRMKTIQVNMTITTDSESVRKVFEPSCPSNQSRLKAIKEIKAAGIDSCITLTPLLPVVDAEQFAIDLLATGIKKFIIQPFHAEKGKFVASTRDAALELVNQLDWSESKYNKVLEVIQRHIPEIGIGKSGFKPI